MVKIFTDDHAKGISAYNKLNSKEVPCWVVERMINEQRNYRDDWILQCFFVLAGNSIMFPSAILNIFGSDFALVHVLETTLCIFSDHKFFIFLLSNIYVLFEYIGDYVIMHIGK